MKHIKFLHCFLLSFLLLGFLSCSKDDDTQWEEPITPESPDGPQEPEKKYHNGYEYVDLGLSSGTMWAAYNVGASSPEECGGYYAWGEVTQYVISHYSWQNYKWCYNSMETLTKYNRNQYLGEVDNKTTLELQDDVAYYRWGGKWRMPSVEEWDELWKECSCYKAEIDGVAGVKVVGPNGNSIFLPAAGLQVGAPWFENVSKNEHGYYWSNSLLPEGNGYLDYIAYAIMFDTDPKNNSPYYDIERCHAASVRPVIRNRDNDDNSGVNKDDDENNNDDEEEPDYSGSGYIRGYEYVDLGLSVKWAAYNVGATSPEGYGNYYAWGETTTKSDYSESNYQYHNGSEYVNIGSNICGTRYDVARAQWGGSWRLPTKAEFEELLNRCTWTWTSYNGINGCKVTGPNGKSIFLPAAGYRHGSGLHSRGSYGYLWSGSLNESTQSYAYYLCFNSGYRGVGRDFRECGYTVRPVSE